jgi:hypothetical protein
MEDSDVDVAWGEVAEHWIPARLLTGSRDSPKAFEMYHMPISRLIWVVDDLSWTLDVPDNVRDVFPIVRLSPWAHRFLHQSNLVGEVSKAIDEYEREDPGDEGSLSRNLGLGQPH